MSRRSSCSSCSSVCSTDSPNPADILKKELPNTLPKLLKYDLGIDFEGLRAVDEGSFNVVFGYTDRSDSLKYVIRVSIAKATEEGDDFPGPNLGDQAAILRFLKPYSSKFGSIPKLVHVNATNDNKIGRPYMIQTFLPGQRLDRIWEHDLTLEKIREVIHEFVNRLIKQESVEFSSSGTLCAEPENTGGVEVGRFKKDTVELDTSWSSDLTIQQWLLHLLDFQTKHHNELAAKGLNTKQQQNQIDRLRTIVDEMSEIGLFNDPRGVQSMSKTVLSHSDLQFYNLFAERTNHKDKLQICGVIDWDNAEAKLLPLAREPPYWLWQPQETHDNLDLHARWNRDCDYLPRPYWDLMSDEDKQFKQIFDDAMQARDPSYMDDAYGAGLWIRRVAKLGMWGVSQVFEAHMVNWLCKEWAEYIENQYGMESKLKKKKKQKNTPREEGNIGLVQRSASPAPIPHDFLTPLAGFAKQISKSSVMVVGRCWNVLRGYAKNLVEMFRRH